jgi:hypothetical protein
MTKLFISLLLVFIMAIDAQHSHLRTMTRNVAFRGTHSHIDDSPAGNHRETSVGQGLACKRAVQLKQVMVA